MDDGEVEFAPSEFLEIGMEAGFGSGWSLGAGLLDALVDRAKGKQSVAKILADA